MVYLSKHLEYIRERPGMYIGDETIENLQTYLLGFDAASPFDYASFLMTGVRGLIDDYDTFDEAFEGALERAREAEASAFDGGPLTHRSSMKMRLENGSSPTRERVDHASGMRNGTSTMGNTLTVPVCYGIR